MMLKPLNNKPIPQLADLFYIVLALVSCGHEVEKKWRRTLVTDFYLFAGDPFKIQFVIAQMIREPISRPQDASRIRRLLSYWLLAWHRTN